MATYTNTRPSKVSVCGVSFVSHETRDIPDKGAEALEAKDGKGNLTHPLRKGRTPILRPGHIEAPTEQAVVKVAVRLGDLDLQKALAQVKLCTDLATLAEWHATETRPEVLASIDARGRELSVKG